jgi:hypothetical protein
MGQRSASWAGGPGLASSGRDHQGRGRDGMPAEPRLHHPPARGDQNQEERAKRLGEQAPPLVPVIPEVKLPDDRVQPAEGTERGIERTVGLLLRSGWVADHRLAPHPARRPGHLKAAWPRLRSSRSRSEDQPRQARRARNPAPQGGNGAACRPARAAARPIAMSVHRAVSATGRGCHRGPDEGEGCWSPPLSATVDSQTIMPAISRFSDDAAELLVSG